MATCTLFGIVTNGPNSSKLGVKDIYNPLELLCKQPVPGAICGAFGIKGSKTLGSLLRKNGIITPFASEKQFLECRFDVPKGGEEKRIYLDEMLESKTVNMLRLGRDALDGIAEAWIEKWPRGSKLKEQTFPRTPTIWPSRIATLRENYLPSAELIIFPLMIEDEILAMGAYFGGPKKIKNLHINT